LRGTWSGCSFNGDPEGCVKGPHWEAGGSSTGGLELQALGTFISFHWSPTGEPGRGLIYQGLYEMHEGALEGEHLSLRELCEGNLEEGLLCQGSGRTWGGGLKRWATLSVGAPLGCMGGGPFTGNSES